MRVDPSPRPFFFATVLAGLVASCGGDDSAGTGAGSGGSSGAGGSGPTCAATDVDQDGFDSIECGGTDCDDRDPGLYPGSPMGFAVEVVAQFPRMTDNTDLAENRDVAAAIDVNGNVVIAFEGNSGLWFGRLSNGTWDLQAVSPMANPTLSDPSIAVSGGGEIALGFKQEGPASAAMLARHDGTTFIVEKLWDSSAPPVLTTAPDGTRWVAGMDDAGVFGIGPEANGTFTRTEVRDAFGPPGTRFSIDSAGHHHLLWGATGVAGRIPPIKYSYATDASGTWVITEFDEQCFHDRAALDVAGTDVHISYVRPRNLQGLYYLGPGDDTPGHVIQDARGAYSDTPRDLGTAVTVHQGFPRIAFMTNDAVYLASKLGEGFSSTRVEDATATQNFGSPALIVAPDGLHLFYFGRANDTAGDMQLKHAFFAKDAAGGCTTR
jgi:hypothetical protein